MSKVKEFYLSNPSAETKRLMEAWQSEENERSDEYQKELDKWIIKEGKNYESNC